MAINLDTLSHAELQALIRNAESQMETARKNTIAEVRNKIDSMLKNAKLTLDEVYPRRGKGTKGPKAAVAPKYRNPDNASQTWSGRGKRPVWFNEALKKRGVTAESLLIEGAVPKATGKKAAPKKAARKTAKK